MKENKNLHKGFVALWVYIEFNIRGILYMSLYWDLKRLENFVVKVLHGLIVQYLCYNNFLKVPIYELMQFSFE